MKLIVAEFVADAVRERVAALSLPIEVVVVGKSGEIAANISDAPAFFRAFTSEETYKHVLDSAPQLRWIHTGSAGVDNLLSPALKARNITLTNSAGVYGVPIAEWVLHALLMIAKRGPEMVLAQQARRWADDVAFDELAGKTLTILGAGSIGGEIARRAAAFDMRVWAVNRSGRPVAHAERVISGDAWREALPETDFLVIATPLTAATHGLIGAAELAQLPEHAWLINIARGAIIDEAALLESLQHTTIAGAALDTFEQEPLPPDHPFWTMPNVIVSPHHSGSSPRWMERMIDVFIDNVQRFMNDEELRNVVDQDAGY